MSNTVIQVENLAKRYIISHQSKKSGSYGTLRDSIVDGTRSIARQIFKSSEARRLNAKREEFWALQDVSFEIKQGECVGFIGRNGAGKSTLLKLLSRITEPTRGSIRIAGRVASLLEVGTGFHGELSGRENIYLNGAILGMSKAEITRKFDEIVAFAEVEKFIDTPVKRYSSGMYVRLAFAVAAHLEPEILIIDEVLAVGDTQFQKKCLGKMEDVGRDGRTVLFVSHNMNTVESLCTRGIVLSQGTVQVDGDVPTAINAHLETSRQLTREIALADRRDRHGSGRVQMTSFRVLNSAGKPVTRLESGQDYDLEVGYHNHTGGVLQDVIASFDFLDDKGNTVLLFRTNFTNSNLVLEPDRGYIRCRIRNLPLANYLYQFSVYLAYRDSEVLDYIPDAAFVEVEGGDFFGTGHHANSKRCKILSKSDWQSLSVYAAQQSIVQHS
ncbi:ABC transporter ATP-binding protein [Phormidesmis sp. 146-33]